MRLPRRQALAATTACGAALLLASCGGGGGGGGTTTAGSAVRSVRTALQGTGTSTAPGGAATAAVLAAGRQAFVSNGCAGCHTLAAAGASGTVGPNLDEVLPGRNAAFIHQSIVDPDAVIAKGFSAGTMPTDFGDRIPSAQLAALVTFLRTQAGR